VPPPIRVPAPIRTRDVDACPGALRLHAAADGPLARVRLPGGMLTGDQLAVLGQIGPPELTSRANVQLRGLTDADPDDLAARLSAAGLLPSQTHETVRNIAAPPLADAVMRALVTDLDRALCADPVLAALPGRFLFAIGDVPLAADLAAVPEGDAFTILFAGHDAGLRVPAGEVVETMLRAARVFLDERDNAAGSSNAATGGTVGGDAAAGGAASRDTAEDRAVGGDAAAGGGAKGLAWRLHELADGPARVARALGAPHEPRPVTRTPVTSHIGVLPQSDGLVAVGSLVPLGLLRGEALRLLTGARRLVITPAREVVVPDLTPEAARRWLRQLDEAGLPTSSESRWSGVTACAGRPGCARALADVRADADAASEFAAGLPVHWIGCARGCGSPSGPHVRVEATPTGYQTTRQPTGERFEQIAAARSM
jgi:precorrin-3B synthase